MQPAIHHWGFLTFKTIHKHHLSPEAIWPVCVGICVCVCVWLCVHISKNRFVGCWFHVCVCRFLHANVCSMHVHVCNGCLFIIYHQLKLAWASGEMGRKRKDDIMYSFRIDNRECEVGTTHKHTQTHTHNLLLKCSCSYWCDCIKKIQVQTAWRRDEYRRYNQAEWTAARKVTITNVCFVNVSI